jgi:beta-galactosidase/beta-glucuronidase
MMVRNEYPRPQLERKTWQNLNGKWAFLFDDQNIGLKEKWYKHTHQFAQSIEVPFVYQTKKSGIGVTDQHDTVWYQKNIAVDKEIGKRYLLHFGAVDYFTDVFVNGQHVFYHEGGNTSFTIDVTDSLTGVDDSIVVRVNDPQFDESIPRGKQIWEEKSKGIWYTNTTGIWQTVWLETVSEVYLTQLKMTSLFDEGKVQLIAELNDYVQEAIFHYQIHFKGELVCQGNAAFNHQKLNIAVDILGEKIFKTNYHDEGCSWSPEHPNLFDLTIQITSEGKTTDEINSYFGFRKIHQEKGMVYLNNRPYYQKLVLDQGYWPESLLTAPDDVAFIKDIKLAKEMGFNGCRKHQKTEDPRFLYWADKLGYLVWGECASAPIYNENAVNRLLHEWDEIIERDYNHPSIVTWVPLNESWGIRNIQRDRQQQHFSQTMYHYLHSIDTTRLVISNDGWNMTETDICAIHNYSHGSVDEPEKYQAFKEHLETKQNIMDYPSTSWNIYADGFNNQGEPVILTEFGGIGFKVDAQNGWGYTSVESEKDFISEYQRIMDAVYASKALWGYCYTQLTDVEQEINGLVAYNRQPKCNLAAIKKINDKYHLERINP